MTRTHAAPVVAVAVTTAVACLLFVVSMSAQRSESTAPAFERIPLAIGRSTVLATDFNVTRIAITDPAIADAVVVTPREILLDGKGAGTVSLIVWGDARRVQYDVVVEAGGNVLQQQFQALFPAEDIHVSVNDEVIVLSGTASNSVVMVRAVEIAQATSTKLRVLNLLQLPGGAASQQVMLQVRFAEVNRRAVEELGVSLFSTRSTATARTTTQQFAAPDIDQQSTRPGEALVLSDYLNLFFLNRKESIGAVVKALQSKGYFQSLAEPTLIAYNGQEASFLAGGEFPVPVAQGTTGAVTIVYKEFGIRLTFRPTIAGDIIRLKVRPEVSSLDYANGITLAGFRVPALTTRRAETDVELRDGQSFAIAGLLDNIAQEDSSGIPVLSRIPIIGYLFRSKADRTEQTELMVLITPRLVRPLDAADVPPLPIVEDRFLSPSAR